MSACSKRRRCAHERSDDRGLVRSRRCSQLPRRERDRQREVALTALSWRSARRVRAGSAREGIVSLLPVLAGRAGPCKHSRQAWVPRVVGLPSDDRRGRGRSKAGLPQASPVGALRQEQKSRSPGEGCAFGVSACDRGGRGVESSQASRAWGRKRRTHSMSPRRIALATAAARSDTSSF
jgi:hypothetical protein